VIGSNARVMAEVRTWHEH